MISKSVAAFAVALSLLATGAGAAAVHRLAAVQTSGSEGSTAFFQTSAASSALQGEVGKTSPNTGIKIPFGMFGEYDASTSTFGIGVAGVSTSGYAVGAEAFGGNPTMIALSEASGDALDAFAASGTGVLGSSATGVGVFAIGNNGRTSPVASVETGFPALASMSMTAGTDLYDAFVTTKNGQAPIYSNFQITFGSRSANASISSDDANASDVITYGDVLVGGDVYSSCSGNTSYTYCATKLSDVQHTNSGATVEAFHPRSASPAIEDTGEAQLVAGSARVTLDPLLATTISQTKPYAVLVTPLGDCRGLYVTNRTRTGFDVRELQGGRASLAFDYRIVAQPLSERSQRMSLVAARHDARRPVSDALGRAIRDDLRKAALVRAPHAFGALPDLRAR